MKWSLLVGNFWGTELRLHGSLLLLIPYALVAFRPADIGGALRVLLLIAAIFACVALHELGHTLAARLFGVQVNSIVLWPLGGFANLSHRPNGLLPDLVISAAGPLANLILFGYLALLTIAERLVESSYSWPWLSELLWRTQAFSFLIGLAIANLSLAIFNLIPIYPLDGGQIARGLLKALFGERRADLVMLLFSLPLALGLTVLGLWMRDVLVILTGLLLVLAGSTLSYRLVNSLLMAGLFLADRGGYYLRKQDYDAVIRHYTRRIERKPRLPGLYISRAIAHLNLLDREAARTDVQRALDLDPNQALAWALRGELLALDRQYPEALDAFNQAIRLKPNWSLAYLDRGGVYQDLGDYPRALEDMDKGVELGRGSAVAYLLRSVLRYQMGDLSNSHTDAEHALRYAPQWMLVFPEVFVLNLKGRLAWALDYYARAIEAAPNAYQGYQGRADACRINDRPDWAIADYSRAIDRAPGLAELYLNRGRAWLSAGDPARAALDFQQAARPGGLPHLRRQAEALLRLTGQPAQAAPALAASERAVDQPMAD